MTIEAAPRPVSSNLSPTEARRQEVLRAVSDLIARHGIDGMSMRQVADAVGMSTGTINYHFKNKRGLILAAMDHVYSGPHQDWQRYVDLPPIEQIRRRAALYLLRTDGKKQWWRFWLEYSAHASRDVDLLSSHQEHYRQHRRVFIETLERGQTAGEVRRDIDLDDVADTLIALLDGLATNQIVAGDSIDTARAERLISAYIDSLAT